jgi:hypothetical protein
MSITHLQDIHEHHPLTGLFDFLQETTVSKQISSKTNV